MSDAAKQHQEETHGSTGGQNPQTAPVPLEFDTEQVSYARGEDLACTITAVFPDGYSASVRGDDRRALLITKEPLEIGDEVVGHFRGVYQGRLVLAADNPIIRADKSLEDDEKAVETWALPPHRQFKLKRATDLIMGPIGNHAEVIAKVKDYSLDALVNDIESNLFTGCMKIASEEKESRSALLLCRGRAVGCVYNSSAGTGMMPTEQSLQMILADLALPETSVRMYKLPVDIIFAMSSLFLGLPLDEDKNAALLDARGQLDYYLKIFEIRATTACLAMTLADTQALCLGFVHRGQFCGSYEIGIQTFDPNIATLRSRLDKEPESTIDASSLAAQMTSPLVRFGFSLSVANMRNRY